MNIQGIIDKELADEQAARGKRVRSGKFSPSQMGKCFRAQILNRKNIPTSNPPDERILRVFKAGNLFHDFVQGLIKKQHPEAQIEVRVETEDVCGYADMAGKDTVWDVKSQHSRAFHYMDKSKDIVKDKYPNWLQVMCYALLLGKSSGRLVFVSKDDLCIREYGQPMSDKWEKEVTKELITLKDWWESGQLPPAEPRAYWSEKKKSFGECGYCNFKDVCENMEKEAK